MTQERTWAAPEARPVRRLGLAAEGWPFVLTPAAIALGGAALAWKVWPPLWAIVVVAALAAGFAAYFFRDPERSVPADAESIVSPADGKVTVVSRTESGVRVSIFLSVFDVHVNRVPYAGCVTAIDYREGLFRAAFRDDVHLVNERNHVAIETARGPIEVVQIAGLIARRIVCRLSPGDVAEKGARFGLIRFGSCTDLLLPPNVDPAVAPGDRVRGASSVIARWQPSDGVRP